MKLIGTHHRHQDRRPRRIATVVLAAGLTMACCLTVLGAPASAEGQPLSPEPTAELSCSSGGVSNLTIHWPAGEYGTWRMASDLLGEVSGPGGIFTSPTDETFVVPAGWQADHSTVRLNRDTQGDTTYNQQHFTVAGASCPFSTTITTTFTCASRTLNAAVAAGHITQFLVYDDVTGALLDARNYPEYGLFGDLVTPVPVGPVTLTSTVPSGVTRVRIEITVDNTVLTRVHTISCAGTCARSISRWSYTDESPLNRWPLDTITAGATTYTKAQAQPLLGTWYGAVYQPKLRNEIIAAKLNRAMGANAPGIDALIAQADAELTLHPVDAGMTTAQKMASRDLQRAVGQFNGGQMAGAPLCSCGILPPRP